MKILIKESNKTCCKLWLPTKLLKRKWFIKTIFKDKIDNVNANQLCDFVNDLYQTLKQSIKNLGHFTILDVRSADGATVVIKV